MEDHKAFNRQAYGAVGAKITILWDNHKEMPSLIHSLLSIGGSGEWRGSIAVRAPVQRCNYLSELQRVMQCAGTLQFGRLADAAPRWEGWFPRPAHFMTLLILLAPRLPLCHSRPLHAEAQCALFSCFLYYTCSHPQLTLE